LDLEKVKTYIHNKDIGVPELAKALNISRQSMYLKLSGARSFRAEELLGMAIAMKMKKKEILDIFFNM
jgi:predicted DNA-binding protein YlxM (UPF0122 family)